MAQFIEIQGQSSYQQIHDLQKELVDARADHLIDDTFLLLEHEPTITVGRKKGALKNVLAAGSWPVVEVERGGDVTLHIPGQLVAYPIVALDVDNRDLHKHLHRLEDAVSQTITTLLPALSPQRDRRNTGVWLPHQGGLPRKVCSIGIACRRWVTWHGLALNIDADLAGFQRIQPCGFRADSMTRLADHCPDETPGLRHWIAPLAQQLAEQFGTECQLVQAQDAAHVRRLLELL